MSALMLAVMPVGAMNETVNEYANDSSRVVDLDEVIVVSQPKEQVRLRLQPLSSSVYGSEQLQQLNVHDLSQLSQYVPCGPRSTSTRSNI